MPNSMLFRVPSNEGSNFTEALAQNQASAMNNLAGLPRGGPGYLIRAISVVTKQNFGPQFNFFSSATALTADPATDAFVSRWGFTASMAQQIAGSALWRYYIDGLAIPYVDLDTINNQNPPALHVILVNTEVTAKSAAAAGAIQCAFHIEVQQSY